MTTIAADPEFRALRRYSARIGAEDSGRFVVAAANPSGLRPSIETTLHGVLPIAATQGAAALARCLAEMCARLDPAEPLVTLTAAQEAELLGWDAEKYRQALNAR